MQPTIQLIIKQEALGRKQSGWCVLILYITHLLGRINKTMDNFILQCSWQESEPGTGQTRRKKCCYFYSKTNKIHQFIKFILFWNDTLHVSDGLSVHHQEFKTVHTAIGICQTDTAVCLLVNRQKEFKTVHTATGKWYDMIYI